MEQAAKYFIYARKSSESEDRQVLSVESQIRQLQEISQKRKLKVVNIFREEKSAKEPGRLVFTEMVSRIKAGEAKGIVCWKLNRLARNPVDGGTIQWLLQNKELEHIVSAERDYFSADNVLMMNVEFGMANQFILDLRRDTMRGMMDKARQGWFPFMAPIGYLNDPYSPQGQRKIVVDPKHFNQIRQLWDFLLSGTYTVFQISKKAEEIGIKSKCSNDPIRASSIYRVFTNKFYAGEFDFQGQAFKGSHKPMITMDEFDHAQRILGKRGKPRPRIHSFPFTGMIKCGECGGMVTAENKIKRGKNGQEWRYTYYHCSHRTKTPCKQLAVTKDALEQQINAVILKSRISDKFNHWAIEELRRSNKEEMKGQNQINKNNLEAYNENKKMIDNLLNLKLKEMIDDETYKTKKNTLFAEQLTIKKRMESLEDRTKDWFENAEKAYNFVKYAYYWFNNGNLEDKKIILQVIGSKLILKDKILSIENKKLFNLVAEPAKFSGWYPRQESNLQPSP